MPTNESPSEHVVRRYYDEAFNSGNPAAFDDLVAADFRNHNAFRDQAPGVEGMKRAYAAFRAAFPDMVTTLEDVVAAGDKVAVRSRLEATHRAPFLGYPPTGARVTVEAINIFLVANGKLAERWGVTDALGLLRQLGATVG